VEIIRADETITLSNSGITSCQLIFPENSRSERITITRVRVAPGAQNPPILAFEEGDVVRFEDNDLHGFKNTGDLEFEYLSTQRNGIQLTSNNTLIGP
jgi:quercetin dioxygenase-like cupin family protein